MLRPFSCKICSSTTVCFNAMQPLVDFTSIHVSFCPDQFVSFLPVILKVPCRAAIRTLTSVMKNCRGLLIRFCLLFS